MSIKMKVCGMRDRDNILDVVELRPDYMGFIFYPLTPRYVGDDFKIPENFPSFTKRVGVFVNEDSGTILEKVTKHGLDLVQLHGDEPVQQCAELKAHGIGVIKVFSVNDDMAFDVTKAYRDAVDFFLFDTRGKYYGGNARTFNWDALRRYDQKVPFFLSGGLTPGNAGAVKELAGLNLHAVDVNSGAETRPALKDIKKIKAIGEIINSKA